MSKPTREEYDTAIKYKAEFSDLIRRENELRDKYLDELLNIRESIKFYKEQYDKASGVVTKYELYEEIEKERKI